MHYRSESQNIAAPVSQQERIYILDSLRGIATLGILLMNVPGFGLPEARANNPFQASQPKPAEACCSRPRREIGCGAQPIHPRRD